jgi:hypothetical protein
MGGLRTELRTEITGFRTDLQTEIVGLRSELRVEMGDLRTGTTDLRTEMRTDIADLRRNVTDLQSHMDRRFEVVDAKIDRHFTWLVGSQVAGLVAVVGARVGSYYR